MYSMMALHNIILPYTFRTLILVLFVSAASCAFVVKAHTRRTTIRHTSRHEALPPPQVDVDTTSSHFWIADGIDGVINVDNTASMLGSLGEGLRTVAIGITVVIFFLAGFAYFTAAILIPKAAEQLELEAKELAPQLWEEYSAKLAPGETLASRPDLLQELGNKITPLIEQKIRREQEERRGFSEDGVDAAISESSSPPPLVIESEQSLPPPPPLVIESEQSSPPPPPPQVIESEQVVSSSSSSSQSSSSSRSTSTSSTVLDAEVVPDETSTDSNKT
jgi:hypothetical protein